MPNVVTLDYLRSAAEKEFAPTKVDLGDGNPITLRNILRLNKKDRTKIMDGVDALNAEDEDGKQKLTLDAMTETVELILSLVADDPKRLLKVLDGDLGVMMQVLNTWMEDTEVGEAVDSPS